MTLDPAIEKLLKDQHTHAVLISRFISNTEKLGANNLTLDTLTNRLQVIDTYWKSFFQNHTELARFEDDLADQAYFINDEFSDTEVKYTLAKTFVTSRLSQLYARAQDGVGPPNPLAAAPAFQITSTASSLPKLTLPKFSGQQADWDSFKDIFSSMVKDQPALTPTLKLQHLLACVEGEAARALKNLQVTGANFEVAWESLSRRYENKRLRISTYMKRLLNLQPAAKKSVTEYTRLLDTTNECRRGLSALGEPVDQWDRWFTSILAFSLDTGSREQWELHLASEDIEPTYQALVTFLEGKIQALDTAHCSEADSSASKPKGQATSKGAKAMSAHHAAEATSPSTRTCPLCQEGHRIGNCPAFKAQTAEQRWKTAPEQGWCFNCLSGHHKTATCPSSYRCRSCKQEHHSLLHRPAANSSDGKAPTSSARTASSDAPQHSSLSSHATLLNASTLLGTAYIIVTNRHGHDMQIRALIDPASEGSFVTQRVVQMLGLKKSPMQLSVSGVGGQVAATSTAEVTLMIKPSVGSTKIIEAAAAVLPKLSALLPKTTVVKDCWPHLKGLQLTDATFAVPAPVDCVLGADVYPEIILDGLRRGAGGAPIAQNTVFGWILIGPSEPTTTQSSSRHRSSFNTTIQRDTALCDQLRLFWEIEEGQHNTLRSPEEDACDQHFSETHARAESGRYVVKLPFKEAPSLPGSCLIAQQRLFSLEKRLQKDQGLKAAYSTFMTEYLDLGHMRLANEVAEPEGAYLPHHAVHSPSSNKLRVVFNASQEAKNSKSLNNYLHAGPKLQQDISTILLRWRTGKIAFTADIVKMFRQIVVDQEDCKWQRILWRSRLEDSVQAYDLTTVTYGTACAPYLALRVLQQLAQDEQQQHFPLGAAVLRSNMYVDDALVSADSLDEAQEIKTQLVGILQSAGMQLSKWSASTPSLGIESRPQPNQDLIFDAGLQVPTLGLRWTPVSDTFSFRSVPTISAGPITKRGILSMVARIYDPVGWISPITVRAKILLQQLWLSGHDWDAPVDTATCQAWQTYCEELPRLHAVALPRWLGIKKTTAFCLHGFFDASERAYAAVIYLVSHSKHSSSQVVLVAARCKVAPVKSMSLPRLELRGALLLAQLMQKTHADLDKPDVSVNCWTDSEVVLAWLRAHPCTWKTFVGNRVAEIHELLPSSCWAHVRSKQNPADLGSRGCTPDELLNSSLWWKGPAWITTAPNHSKQPSDFTTELEKRSKISSFVASQEASWMDTILQRVSTLSRACRVFAYCLRWRSLMAGSDASAKLSADELHRARLNIISAVQAQHFSADITALKKTGSLAKTSSLLPFHPLLDEQGLLRVGGRLDHAGLKVD